MISDSIISYQYHIISVSYHIISYHIISYHIISYHIISYHIISYLFISFQISYRAIFALTLRFCPVPVQIFQVLVPSSRRLQDSDHSFRQLAPCIASVETCFSKGRWNPKSKTMASSSSGTYRCVFFFFNQILYIQMLFFCNYINSPFFNPTILQGIDVWKDLSLSCWGHWGHDQISHPLILMTRVVVVGMSQSILCCQQQLYRCLSSQIPFPLSMNDSGCFVFVWFAGRLIGVPFFNSARQQWSEIFLDKSNWMGMRWGCLDSQRGSDKKSYTLA